MRSTRELVAVLTLVAAGIWLVTLTATRDGFIAGDPLAIYFPIVQNIFAGKGAGGFAPLFEGAGRVPGYPLALAPFAAVFGDLIVASRALGVVSGLAVLLILFDVLRRAGAPLIVRIGAPIATAATPAFVQHASEPLPDMFFLALFAAIFWLIWRDARETRPGVRRALAAGAGLLAGCATLVRFNGLGLALGVPVALIANSRSDWIRRAGLPLVSFFAVVFPTMAVLSRRLGSFGIEYPRGSQDLLFVPAPGQSRFDALLDPYVAGIEVLFTRLADMVTLPAAALGLPAVVYAAFKLEQVEAKTLFWLTGAVLGMVIPLHFEPRYWLPVVPSLFAAFLWSAVRLGERLDLEKRTVTVIATLTLVAITATTGSHTLRHIGGLSASAAGVIEICRELARAAPPKGTVIVGVPDHEYAYSAFRECPRPRRDHPRLVLVPATPETQGLDFWVQYGARTSTVGVEEVVSSGGFTLSRVVEEGPEPEGEELMEPLSLDVPRNPAEPCIGEGFQIAQGASVLGFEVSVPRPLAARIVIRSDAGEWRLIASGKVRRWMPIHTNSGWFELWLCASDPLRSKGRMTIERMWVAPQSVTALQN